jgi:hypothetical protein
MTHALLGYVKQDTWIFYMVSVKYRYFAGNFCVTKGSRLVMSLTEING